MSFKQPREHPRGKVTFSSGASATEAPDEPKQKVQYHDAGLPERTTLDSLSSDDSDEEILPPSQKGKEANDREDEDKSKSGRWKTRLKESGAVGTTGFERVSRDVWIPSIKDPFADDSQDTGDVKPDGKEGDTSTLANKRKTLAGKVGTDLIQDPESSHNHSSTASELECIVCIAKRQLFQQKEDAAILNLTTAWNEGELDEVAIGNVQSIDSFDYDPTVGAKCVPGIYGIQYITNEGRIKTTKVRVECTSDNSISPTPENDLGTKRLWSEIGRKRANESERMSVPTEVFLRNGSMRKVEILLSNSDRQLVLPKRDPWLIQTRTKENKPYFFTDGHKYRSTFYIKKDREQVRRNRQRFTERLVRGDSWRKLPSSRKADSLSSSYGSSHTAELHIASTETLVEMNSIPEGKSHTGSAVSFSSSSLVIKCSDANHKSPADVVKSIKTGHGGSSTLITPVAPVKSKQSEFIHSQVLQQHTTEQLVLRSGEFNPQEYTKYAKSEEHMKAFLRYEDILCRLKSSCELGRLELAHSKVQSGTSTKFESKVNVPLSSKSAAPRVATTYYEYPSQTALFVAETQPAGSPQAAVSGSPQAPVSGSPQAPVMMPNLDDYVTNMFVPSANANRLKEVYMTNKPRSYYTYPTQRNVSASNSSSGESDANIASLDVQRPLDMLTLRQIAFGKHIDEPTPTKPMEQVNPDQRKEQLPNQRRTTSKPNGMKRTTTFGSIGSHPYAGIKYSSSVISTQSKPASTITYERLDTGSSRRNGASVWQGVVPIGTFSKLTKKPLVRQYTYTTISVPAEQHDNNCKSKHATKGYIQKYLDLTRKKGTNSKRSRKVSKRTSSVSDQKSPGESKSSVKSQQRSQKAITRKSKQKQLLPAVKTGKLNEDNIAKKQKYVLKKYNAIDEFRIGFLHITEGKEPGDNDSCASKESSRPKGSNVNRRKKNKLIRTATTTTTKIARTENVNKTDETPTQTKEQLQQAKKRQKHARMEIKCITMPFSESCTSLKTSTRKAKENNLNVIHSNDDTAKHYSEKITAQLTKDVKCNEPAKLIENSGEVQSESDEIIFETLTPYAISSNLNNNVVMTANNDMQVPYCSINSKYNNKALTVNDLNVLTEKPTKYFRMIHNRRKTSHDQIKRQRVRKKEEKQNLNRETNTSQNNNNKTKTTTGKPKGNGNKPNENTQKGKKRNNTQSKTGKIQQQHGKPTKSTTAEKDPDIEDLWSEPSEYSGDSEMNITHIDSYGSFEYIQKTGNKLTPGDVIPPSEVLADELKFDTVMFDMKGKFWELTYEKTEEKFFITTVNFHKIGATYGAKCEIKVMPKDRQLPPPVQLEPPDPGDILSMKRNRKATTFNDIHPDITPPTAKKIEKTAKFVEIGGDMWEIRCDMMTGEYTIRPTTDSRCSLYRRTAYLDPNYRIIKRRIEPTKSGEILKNRQPRDTLTKELYENTWKPLIDDRSGKIILRPRPSAGRDEGLPGHYTYEIVPQTRHWGGMRDDTIMKRVENVHIRRQPADLDETIDDLLPFDWHDGESQYACDFDLTPRESVTPRVSSVVETELGYKYDALEYSTGTALYTNSRRPEEADIEFKFRDKRLPIPPVYDRYESYAQREDREREKARQVLTDPMELGQAKFFDVPKRRQLYNYWELDVYKRLRENPFFGLADEHPELTVQTLYPEACRPHKVLGPLQTVGYIARMAYRRPLRYGKCFTNPGFHSTKRVEAITEYFRTNVKGPIVRCAKSGITAAPSTIRPTLTKAKKEKYADQFKLDLSPDTLFRKSKIKRKKIDNTGYTRTLLRRPLPNNTYAIPSYQPNYPPEIAAHMAPPAKLDRHRKSTTTQVGEAVEASQKFRKLGKERKVELSSMMDNMSDTELFASGSYTTLIKEKPYETEDVKMASNYPLLMRQVNHRRVVGNRTREFVEQSGHGSVVDMAWFDEMSREIKEEDLSLSENSSEDDEIGVNKTLSPSISGLYMSASTASQSSASETYLMNDFEHLKDLEFY